LCGIRDSVMEGGH